VRHIKMRAWPVQAQMQGLQNGNLCSWSVNLWAVQDGM
jgi:hypothetical protein